MNNTYRIIFWSFILMLCLTAGILGVFRNNQVYNSNKNELSYIVDSFNNSEIVRNFRVEQNVLISASLNRTNITITYDAGETKKNYKYAIGLGYLESTYDKKDSFAHTFTMLLVDSISEYYGRNKKETYTTFNNDRIFAYNFEEGLSIKSDKDKYIVKINLKTPLTLYQEPVVNANNNSEKNEITE